MSVLHTFAYNEITAVSNGVDGYTYGGNLYPLLSADASHATFQTSSSGTTHVWIINADGTGQREIDSFQGNTWAGQDISADGSTVIWLTGNPDGWHIRMAYADGTPAHDVIRIYGGYLRIRLSSDGSQVFFTDRYDFSVDSVPWHRGLYVVNADGSDLRKIVNGYDVGNLLGIPPEFIDRGGLGVDTDGSSTLAMTSDGSQVIFGVRVLPGSPAEPGEYLLGVNFAGGGLHQIVFSPLHEGVDSAAISSDGSKVAYQLGSTPAEIGVIKFDGSERHVLADHNFRGEGHYVQISADGSQLLVGDAGVLINTATGATQSLAADLVAASLVDGTMYRVTMDSTATHFAYLPTDRYLLHQVATLDLDPTFLGDAPSLDNLTIDPSAIVADGGVTRATVSATVSTPYTLTGVGYVVLKDGLWDQLVWYDLMYDAGHPGVFSRDNVTASTSAVPGPRSVQVKAEVNELPDRSGKRHATAVEFDPFEVDAPLGPSGGGRRSSTVRSILMPGHGSGPAVPATEAGSTAISSQLRLLGTGNQGEQELAPLVAGQPLNLGKLGREVSDTLWAALRHEDALGMVDASTWAAFDLALALEP